MNESLWTFAFELANFVVLAAVLARVFFKPVRRAIDERRAEAQQQRDELTTKLANAERLQKEIETERAGLSAELTATRGEARKLAKQEADELVAAGREHVERERATLRREALHIDKAQATKISRAVATATYGTMKRFLEQIGGPDLERALVAAACRELEALAEDAIAPVTVESATPLDEQSRGLIDAALGDAARTAHFRVDAELEGGLRIATAHGLIDASIAGLARFAERSLSEDMESMLRESSDGE